MKGCMKLAAVLFLLTLISCSKSTETISISHDLAGKWTIDQIYGNDYWGGPSYWHKAIGSVQVEFTTTGEYYRKEFYENSLRLVGHFTIEADSTILVVPVDPIVYDPDHPEWSNYSLNYRFEPGGYLILGLFNYENRQFEKYSVAK